MLTVLFDPILPVFAILAIGFAAGRLGKVDDTYAKTLNHFAMNVLLPIFVFRAVALAPISDFHVGALATYAIAQAVLYSIGFLIAWRGFGCGISESILLGFCGVFANNAYYVLPIAKFLYGDASVLPVASVVILDAVLAFGCTMIALEVRAGRDAGAGLVKVVRRVLGIPVLWGVVAGLVVSGYGLAIPAPIETFTAFVGNAASPIALFAMGVVLAGTPMRPQPVAIAISGIKIVVFPLSIAFLTGLVFATAPVSPLYLLASAGPTGVMAFSMALLYSVRTEAVMQVTVLTSVLTLFTLAYLA